MILLFLQLLLLLFLPVHLSMTTNQNEIPYNLQAISDLTHLHKTVCLHFVFWKKKTDAPHFPQSLQKQEL